MRAVHLALVSCAAVAGTLWVALASGEPPAMAPNPVVASREPRPPPLVAELPFEPRLRELPFDPVGLGAAPVEEREAVVRGWIHDEAGQPIEAAALTALRDTVEIDLDPEDGTFTARGPAGDFALIARAEGLLSERVDSLHLEAGEEVREVDVTLRRGLKLEGRVLGDEGPLVGTHVTVEAAGYLRTAFTDDDGRFTLDGLPPGAAKVTAYDDSAGTDEVETHSGDLDVVLRPGKHGTITGVVLDAEGHPVEDAMVFIDETDPRANVAEHDPFGKLPNVGIDITLGAFGCGPMPQCLSRARSDEAGHFELEVGAGAKVTVVASLGAESASATTTASAAPLTLRFGGHAAAHLRAFGGDGKPWIGTLSLRTDRSGLAAADRELIIDANGDARVQLWPGVPMVLEVPAGARVEFPEGAPPDLTVESAKNDVFD